MVIIGVVPKNDCIHPRLLLPSRFGSAVCVVVVVVVVAVAVAVAVDVDVDVVVAIIVCWELEGLLFVYSVFYFLNLLSTTNNNTNRP